MHKSSIVTLGGKEYEVSRSKLRHWLQLEDLREEIVRATDREDREKFIASIYSYLSVALSVDMDFSILPWFEIANSFSIVRRLNYPQLEFPMLQASGEKEEMPWSYEGRSWYAWVNILAGEYNWTMEYVAELDIDDAIGLVQEINVEDQLNREWEWMLSEKSVSYDKQGKGKFNELSRPDWMNGAIILSRESKDYPIKRSMLPVGMVLSWNNEQPIDA